jgi:hypothetical protein
MKLFVIIVLVLLVAACSGNRGWSTQDQQQFLGGCVSNAQKEMTAEKAKDYCTCMLEKVRMRYPNASETRYMKQDSVVYRFGRECLQASTR